MSYGRFANSPRERRALIWVPRVPRVARNLGNATPYACCVDLSTTCVTSIGRWEDWKIGGMLADGCMKERRFLQSHVNNPTTVLRSINLPIVRSGIIRRFPQRENHIDYQSPFNRLGDKGIEASGPRAVAVFSRRVRGDGSDR